MEHSSPPRRSSQTQGDLQAPSGAYSPIQDYIPGQCIAGTGAHRESLHNAQTRDMCICTGMIHPGPWPLHLCKDCQSICTDLNEKRIEEERKISCATAVYKLYLKISNKV